MILNLTDLRQNRLSTDVHCAYQTRRCQSRICQAHPLLQLLAGISNQNKIIEFKALCKRLSWFTEMSLTFTSCELVPFLHLFPITTFQST